MTALLEVCELNAWYGDGHVLQGVSFEVGAGELTAILGRNGAGKTTLLKAMMGLVRKRSGEVRLDGRRLDRLPAHRIARAGLAYVPETRGIFPSLSVLENLCVAARPGRGPGAWTLARALESFPRLAERRRAKGGALSGGEQQMLSLARALMTNGRALVLDEPSEGLAPAILDEIEALLAALKADGTTILLVEQNLPLALRLADQVLVLGKGRLRWQGPAAQFATATEARETWIGV